MAFLFFAETRMSKRIVIVSGGRLGNLNFFRSEMAKAASRLLIACDGGARYLASAGIRPDVLLGDMDSLAPEQLAEYEKGGVEILRHKTDKDFTDTALALDYALALQPSAVDIWGALGGRMDHALANIHLLIRGRQAGVGVRLVDDYSEMLAPDGEIAFGDAIGCLVSLLALSEVVEGITVEGFRYPLTNENLLLSESRGISNLITASPATIRFRKGHLLVIRYWKKDFFPEAA